MVLKVVNAKRWFNLLPRLSSNSWWKLSVSVGVGGEGGGYNPPSTGSAPYTPTARPDSRNGTGQFGGYEHPQYSYPMGHTYYTQGQTGTDSSFRKIL